MHFFLLTIVVTLTASMSVNAATPCVPHNDPEATCQTNSDCCDGYICFYRSVSMSRSLCFHGSPVHHRSRDQARSASSSRLRIEPAARETRRDSESCFCFRVGIIRVDGTTSKKRDHIKQWIRYCIFFWIQE
ncbi:uncharacterized protein HD556DRAFT_1343300 [Suillus plorans]|uniref:Uncharacterized protein n=1 Tax=Suillus plorans TaxID=116603 RepID=A0A9P7DQE6_9AGAM|nr:uncharacterized protein HD556DRAFT_1343300 [Suillus plorans]KAG1800400.1 hypothetical protein HD556DRAFT_1343300 [Suillus plorans]